MAKYTFDIRLAKIVPHTATISVEAENIASAIEQVRRNGADGAVWEPESGYWADDLMVDGLRRGALDFKVQGEPIDELSLAWFKRWEAKQVAA